MCIDVELDAEPALSAVTPVAKRKKCKTVKKVKKKKKKTNGSSREASAAAVSRSLVLCSYIRTFETVDCY